MLKFNKEIKIGNRMIGPDYPAYFIAEIGGNFDGSIDKAKRLIDAAKEAGADCAKFQTFTAETIVSEGGFSRMTLHGVHGSWGRTVSEVFRDVEFPMEWHQEIADYCKSTGIDFSTSPYFKEAVDLCTDMKLPFIKIGSGEITWLEMIDYIASKGIPVMLATGDATMSEIDEAVRTIEKTGNKDLVLMQCITNYPSKIESANVNVLKTYQNAFGCLTGYSDHSPGHVVALASVVLGGRVIEKHFTLDSSQMGMDNNMAMEPEEMKALVRKCHNVYEAMGNMERVVSEKEKAQLIKMRRSIVAKENLKAGTILEDEILDYKRPGNGLPPVDRNRLVGRKLIRDIKKGFFIMTEDLEKEEE